MTNNKQQTAVEWYAIEMANYLKDFYGDGIINIDILKQAKEMEKEGMIGLLEWMNSVNQSDPMRLETDNDDIVEQYHKETYGI